MKHIPRSTYRIQFTSAFGFRNALEIVNYLSDLGISDLYASPVLKAKKGSTHGYDVVDPTQLNPELGTVDDFDLLIEELKKNKLEWLQDIVPNHMAYSFENQMIVDLLENGPASRYYNYFDIEWNHPFASARQRVLAPFLGKFYQQVLEGGELKIKYDSEGFSVNYYENRFPLKFESYTEILSFRMDKLKNKLGKNHPDVIKYMGVLYVLKSLPVAEEEMDERYDQIKFLKGLLWNVYSTNQDIKVFVDENLKIINGEKGNPESYNMLDHILSEQYYRLAYWKVASEEINYRRFFNVSELISLNMENEDTFNRVHSYILRLVKDKKICGLRIDHIDGLFNPSAYLNSLRERIPQLYLVVEKILDLDEELPSYWPVEGTTGYEFANYVNGLFVSRDSENEITKIYERFTKITTPYEDLVLEKKRLIIRSRMAGEVERLAFLVEAVSSKDRYGVDITMHGLKGALEEILTFFPIYRTYISPDNFTPQDRAVLEEVCRMVMQERPRLSNEFNYIFNLLLQKYEYFSEEQREGAMNFVMKFQQLTGPLMAKGFEDTTLYVYNRFVSLNEVGGKPGRFGITPDEFHEFNLKRMEKWPHTLNSTSTHDTKRGEDVRARINVLSEMPQLWKDKVDKWHKLNQHYKKKRGSLLMPDKNDEYFLYQTMVGSYPLLHEEHTSYIDRLKQYMVKAVKEAKVHTAWIKPDEEYEAAVMSYVENILNDSTENEFLHDFISFQNKVVFYGLYNALSQLIIKMTSPGVPDLYQGSELWDFSLVDPDNRRPVDYELRKKYLEEIKSFDERNDLAYIDELMGSMKDGRIKMYLAFKLLKARSNYPSLFREGKYIPLRAEGKYGKNIIAFARSDGSSFAIIIVPRYFTTLVEERQKPVGSELWDDTRITLPGKVKEWRNAITGECTKAEDNMPVGELLKNFPAGLLLGEEPETQEPN